MTEFKPKNLMKPFVYNNKKIKKHTDLPEELLYSRVSKARIN